MWERLQQDLYSSTQEDVQGRLMRPPMGNLVLVEDEDNGGMNTALMLECTLYTEILNGLLVGKELPLKRPAPGRGKCNSWQIQ